MMFNGVDPRTLHKGISIAKEIPPGTVTSQLETLSGSTGEIIVGRTVKQAEYIVRVNIAGKYIAQAWEIRSLLAAWACPTDEVTHELIPTHWPTVAYDAILKEISPPEFRFGFATVDVVFAVPRPLAHDVEWSHADDGAVTVAVTFGGTAHARPELWLSSNGGEGIVVYMDGEELLRVGNDATDRNVMKIFTDTGAVTIDGVHREDLIDYTSYDYVTFANLCTPGDHTITCAGVRNAAVRWRNEWV